MKTIFTGLFLVVFAGSMMAQNLSSGQAVYDLPFASSDNTIDLAVENTASVSVDQLTVTVQNPPAWLSFKSNRATIERLTKVEEKTASFVFSVGKQAPVKKEQTLTFFISGPNNQSWTKEINVSVSPPERFELFQNYPNPFNPVTTISYQLTTDSKVSLRIYNMLGQEVTTLVDGEREAGYHREVWDASKVASGTYIYRLATKDLSGKDVAAQRRMVIVK